MRQSNRHLIYKSITKKLPMTKHITTIRFIVDIVAAEDSELSSVAVRSSEGENEGSDESVGSAVVGANEGELEGARVEGSLEGA